MSDRREEILEQYNLRPASPYDYDSNVVSFYQVKNAMDEHFKERALELLEFMFENSVEIGPFGPQCFYYKGEWITKEQLFKTFL